MNSISVVVVVPSHGEAGEALSRCHDGWSHFVEAAGGLITSPGCIQLRGFYPGERRTVILPTNKPAQEPGQMFVGAFKRVIVALKSHSCHIQDTGDASLSGPGSLTKWVVRSTC